jgi:hypothetical protein
MNTTNETSKPKAADPVYVFMSSNCSRPSGSVAFSGLEKENALTMSSDVGKLIQVIASPGAESETAPVAAAVDSTPTNWFELGASLCLEGRITETRFRRAADAVRKGVDRA